MGLVIRVINSTGKIKDNFTCQVESFARFALASKGVKSRLLSVV